MKVETKVLKESLELLTSIIHLDNLKPITSFLQICARDNKLHMGMSNNITKINLFLYDFHNNNHKALYSNYINNY